MVINNSANVTYTPAVNFDGMDVFTYQVSDGNGGTDTATVTITINGVNDAPIADNDEVVTDEDTPVTIAVLENDTDADSDELTVDAVTQPAYGTVLNNGSDVIYTPNVNFYGTDSFVYTVGDGNGGSDTGIVEVSVRSVNDAPIALNDQHTVAEGGILTVEPPGVLGNDTDVEDDTLYVTLVSSTIHGTLTLYADGSFTYIHNGSEMTGDSFTYQVSDAGAMGNSATVSITVIPVNDAPLAVEDAYFVDEGTTLVIPAPGVLSNDSDLDDDVLTVARVNDVAHGTLVLNVEGGFSYTHDGSETTSDEFTYQVNDGEVDSNLATVSIVVNPVNDAPRFTSTPVVTAVVDTLYQYRVTIEDNDVNDVLTITSLVLPESGWLTLNTDGSGALLSGTPSATDWGEHTVMLQVQDTAGVTVTQPFIIDVTFDYEAAVYEAFLPFIAHRQTPISAGPPDLVVESIVATTDTVQVVIKNQGNSSVVNAFWVQVYIDPNPAPSMVNELWYDLSDQGLVWGISRNALPIVAGESLTLTYGGTYYYAEYSTFYEMLSPGTPIYAQVDAYNAETDYGAVLEVHELEGGEYNNITGPVYSTTDASYTSLTPAVHPLETDWEFVSPSSVGLPAFPFLNEHK